MFEPFENDSCEHPRAVDVGTIYFNNDGATTDGPDEPGACALMGYTQIDADVWFAFTSPCTESVIVSLCAGWFDTKVAVYDGGQCPMARAIACSDDDCGPGLGSWLIFAGVSGQTYLIRVGGFQGDTGLTNLTIYCESDPGYGIAACGASATDCFESGDGPGCTDAVCCEYVCDVDPFCCDTRWDLSCAQKAEEVLCRDTPPEVCGPGAGDCNDAAGNGTPGCEEPDCCWAVCQEDPFCCLNEWDDICASAANYECGFAACEGATGNCLSEHPTPGCDDELCCNLVCSLDPLCCTNAWDDLCAQTAQLRCP
jgi:hypothetical protein